MKSIHYLVFLVVGAFCLTVVAIADLSDADGIDHSDVYAGLAGMLIGAGSGAFRGDETSEASGKEVPKEEDNA